MNSFDFTPFAETAALLYGGPFVCERVSGIHKWLKESGKEPKDDTRLEPIERQIMQSGWNPTAKELYDFQYQLNVNQVVLVG